MGLTYLYPRYLAEVRGYSAMMIGETMFVSGVAMFLMAPIVGRLMTKVDLRALIALGLTLFRGRHLADDLDHARLRFFTNWLLPQILRGMGMMLAMVPINNIALGTLAPERLKNASGLFQPDAEPSAAHLALR